jgi:hypothetical protein
VQDEVLGITADILPISLMEYDRSGVTLLEQVPKVLATEGRVATEQGVCDDSHRPHIHGLAVALAVHDLGGGIAERASHGLERLLLTAHCLGNTEVGEDEVGSELGRDVK